MGNPDEQHFWAHPQSWFDIIPCLGSAETKSVDSFRTLNPERENN